jgi:hypothetical protein
MSFSGGGAPDWAVFVAILGVGMSFLWIYIAWRAMRAHERLAAAADQIAQNDTKHFAAAIAGRSSGRFNPEAGL